MSAKYFIIGLILIGLGCKDNKVEPAKIDFNNNPFMDAIYNSSSADNPADSSHLAKIHFLETEYNFGTIQEGDTVTHEYKFINNGNARLLISKASSSCGCTIAHWPKGFIKPNDTNSIKIVFNSKDKSGNQSKPITIVANTKPNETIIKFHGIVLLKKVKK